MLYGITMGDANGIGPEVLLKAFAAGEIERPVAVFGDLAALEFYNARLQCGVAFRAIANAAGFVAGRELNVVDHRLLSSDSIAPGELSRASGRAARAYVLSAARAALAGEIAAMVTLPVNKEAVQLSDPGFTGHTELIGEVCGARDVTIMLASPQLIVTHVSTHISLAEAIRRCRQERVRRILELTVAAVRRLKPEPRIAVAGLNPHAGEHGLFGDEEIREICPAVEWARSQGMPVEGPFPPDTVFYLAVKRKQFDAIVCMYHDQGHIPLKLLDFEGGVNITLGLPIIRTSVDHGTAFDIAGKGVASTASLVHALAFAARLAEG